MDCLDVEYFKNPKGTNEYRCRNIFIDVQLIMEIFVSREMEHEEREFGILIIMSIRIF